MVCGCGSLLLFVCEGLLVTVIYYVTIMYLNLLHYVHVFKYFVLAATPMLSCKKVMYLISN